MRRAFRPVAHAPSRHTRFYVVRALGVTLFGVLALAPVATSSPRDAAGVDRWTLAPTRTAIVGYGSLAVLGRALREHRGTRLSTTPI